MRRDDIRIIFMGTPGFSEVILKGLVENGFNVVLCVCQPDKPVGRKNIITAPPAKEYAQSKGIAVYQPEKLRTGEALEELRSFSPDMIITAAYGKILPPDILELPRFGCINVHASLLPRYRGAAPVQYSIMNGDDVTGVTIMNMDEGMDTGDILRQTRVPIDVDDNTATLTQKLADEGRELLLASVLDYVEGHIIPMPQNEEKVTLSYPIRPEDGIIDWDTSSRKIHDKIRALRDWPGASSVLDGKRIKIYESSFESESYDEAQPGEITVARKGDLKVRCGEGSIYIRELQTEGGKRLKASDCAHNFRPGQRFGV